jgi:hypothetical protein
MTTALEVRNPTTEAIAGVLAASSVFNTMGGNTDTPAGTFFVRLASRIFADAFPEVDALDEPERDRHPVEVEVSAREAELTAKALDEVGFRGRAELYRSYSERMREAGTRDVPFRVSDEGRG